jgi:tRNA A-37 threonylcarbamoyl transferase component Bud32
MGRVYLATEHRLGRRVALKALAPELAGDQVHRERLRREARAAAALSDPGICIIHAFEEIEGNVYIVSEFLNGCTLRQEIEAGRRPTLAEVRRTAQDLAVALSSAHRQGITHRDLKPENVMRTADGRLKILDFGLALVEANVDALKSLADNLTLPRSLVGTPAYMAPEQLRGERADSRTDVFAFGVLLFEYACGVHPFAADNPMGIMARILESEPTPVTTFRRDLPVSLVAVVNRCLPKAPADRFQSAIEIVRALGNTGTASAPDRLTAWWRTHQVAVTGLYFVACALAWQVKEWRPGIATAVFFAIGVAATVGGFFRCHLLFTERVNRNGLEMERHRAASVTEATDYWIALALVIDGALLAFDRPVPAVLTIALGVVIAFTRRVVEESTTRATFAQPESG